MTEDKAKYFESSVKREQGKLLGFIRKSVPSTEEAEDILQDVWFQFYHSIESVEILEKTTAWLFKVAKNRIIDFYRKSKNRQTVNSFFKENSEEMRSMNLEEIIPDLASLPDSVYWQNRFWEELEEALEDLPASQREVFEMHEFSGMDFKEMSRRTGESINTLLSRKRYAILFLRKRLRELYEEIENYV